MYEVLKASLTLEYLFCFLKLFFSRQGPIEFLPNGKMLISVGGFSNGGISVPGNTKIDGIGGFPENPLSGAIIECPSTGVTNIKYSTALPGPAKITSGGACKVYAPGVRNSFGMHYHTNGKLYATDNGPNDGFGPFATDCNGGQKDDFDVKDRLFLVEPGQCHGHPNLNRAINDNKPKQCIFQNPECVQPIEKNFEPSTNGVVEYRSNIFGPEVQGNLFLSKFVPGCDPEKNDCSINLGRLSRLVLNVVGGVAANGRTEKFKSVSGVSIVEGPRGELIMSRARRFDEGFIVFKPSYKVPTTTMFISVMPRRGPAGGGNLVTVTGHNFGETPTATFGGKACTNPVSVDDETFTCTIPAGAKNTQVKVTVEGKAGISSGISTDYWYH